MKELTMSEMENVSGGAKCIYHGMGVLLAGNPIGFAINYFSGNFNAVYECWNNRHKE
jgi:bacteriocin-like protein